MSQLQYKTPNMCEPKGLPRVYFCAHPDNYELLEEIAELLLEQKPCSVWYTGAAEKNGEQHNICLSQMQLLVMPVTFRLLTTESFAFRHEYSYAVEHNIPILPLMLEEGLEEIFRDKCGNIPFVPYHRDGVKAGEFKENVKQFLDTVVIGDELAERIRQEFSTYIFLGYGKNDWQDAHKVMGMIQENVAGRDVGIRCDELFTTEDKIAFDMGTAMGKSKLFALSVTPDLLENKNVVATEGYRMAVQDKLPVLAMEMSPVSSFKFKWKYKKVTSYAKSPEEFATALRNQLEGAGIQGKQPSAEHGYLMGLAYLGGVDMVVDHRKAAELITRGAEADYPEAMERLAVMYGYGMGVKRDMEAAMRWLEKYCTAAQNNPYKVFGALQQWAKLYKLAGKQREAKERYVAAIEYLESCTAMEEKEKTLLFIAIYKQLAEVAGISGDPQEVEEYRHKVVVYLEQSCRERNTIEKKRALAFAFEDLGDAYAENKHFEDAKEYYHKAMEIYTPQVQETRDDMWRHRIATIHGKLGDLAGEQNQKAEAKQYYEETRKQLWNLRVRHYETLQVYFDYAFCKMKLADAYAEAGETEPAYRHCLDACGEFRRLYEKLGSIPARYYQIICESKAGDIDVQKGHFAAQRHRMDAVKWMLQLFSEYEFLWMQHGLLEELIKFGEYWIKRGLEGESRIYAKDILQIFGEFLAQEEKLRIDTAEQEHLLLDCYEKLWRVARLTKDEKAMELFGKKAADYKEKVFGQSSGVEEKMVQGKDFEALGDSEAKQECYEEAENYYRKALAIWEEVATERLSDALDAHVRIYIKLGDLENWEDRRKANKYYWDAFSAANRWVKEYDTKEAKRSLATCYERISFADGRLYLQKALDLREELVNGNGELEDYYALADCYVKMGHTYTGKLHPEKRTEYYGMALQVREKVLSLRDSMEDRYKLAHLYLEAILECHSLENKEAYFGRAQAIVEEIPMVGDYYRLQYEKGQFIYRLAKAAYVIYDARTASEYSERAIKIFKELVEKYPCKESVKSLMYAHFQFGEYWDMVVGNARWLHVCKGHDVVREWVEKKPRGREGRELLAESYVASYGELGGKEALDKARELYEKLVEDYPGDKKYRETLELLRDDD